MDNNNKTKTSPTQMFFNKIFPGIKPDSDGMVNIKFNDMLEFFDEEYGRHLNRVFQEEWELSKRQDELIMFEEEHSDSLALIMENESQKILLKEFNDKLNILFEMHAKDMKMAENVQHNLLFEAPPAVKNFDIAFHYQPCSSVSGDFYDFYLDKETNNLKGLVLADVSGHGIASSLLTILAKPIFFREFNGKDDTPINIVLDKINGRLIKQMSSSEKYLTAVLLRFNGNKAEYTNSAHPDIIMRKASDNSVARVIPENGSIQGSLLGIEAVAQPFTSYNFNIEQGDSLVIYTDCLTESQNPSGEEFGENGVIKVLSRSDGSDAGSILKNLLEDFQNFTSEKYLKDDLSIIVLKKL